MPKKYRLYQLLTTLIMTLVIIYGLMLIWIFNINSQPESYEIALEGKELSDNYSLYQNKIYVLLPGRGNHLVDEADSATFRVLNKYGYSPAVDKSNVYCGRTILKGLNPEKVQLIGHHYITDGTKSYYCGVGNVPPQTGMDEKIQHLAQSLLHFIGLALRPMDWQYPNYEISNMAGTLK